MIKYMISKSRLNRDEEYIIKEIDCDICNSRILQKCYPIISEAAQYELAIKNPERYALLYEETNRAEDDAENSDDERMYVTLDAPKDNVHMLMCMTCFNDLNVAFFKRNVRNGKVILEGHHERCYFN